MRDTAESGAGQETIEAFAEPCRGRVRRCRHVAMVSVDMFDREVGITHECQQHVAQRPLRPAAAVDKFMGEGDADRAAG